MTSNVPATTCYIDFDNGDDNSNSMISSILSTTYYVDFSNGSDSNNGLYGTYQGNSNGPWKTIEKVNNALLDPGDQILFKRGEIWRGELDISSSGLYGAPIIYGAYGNGNKPIITARNSVPNWNLSEKWSLYSTDIWVMDIDAGPIFRLWLSGQEYHRAETLDDIDSIARWYYGENNHKLYVYALSNPAVFYSNIEAPYDIDESWFVCTLEITDKSYIAIQNLDIRGGRFSSIGIAGANHIVIENCDIGLETNGYGIYGNAWWSDSTADNVIIRNNIINSGALFYDFYPFNGCDGISVRNGAGHWEIYDNTIMDWYHNCIEIQSNDINTPTTYNKVHHNLMTAENISYCRGFSIEGNTDGSCQYNEIYYNVIRNTTVRNQVGGDHNMIYYNIIDGVTNTILYTDYDYGKGQGITLEAMFGGDGVSHYNKIYNNVIHNTDEAGIWVMGYGGVGSPNNIANNEVKNNIILNCGINSNYPSSHYALIIDDAVTVGSNIFQNNDIFSTDFSDIISYKDTVMTVARFNSENGNNGDTISDNIQSNPLFIAPSFFDFHLSDSSLCIDAGMDVGLTQDFEGNTVPQGERVDIGAYEFLSTACPDCSGDPALLTNVTFISGTSCECVNATSITIGPGVTVEAGATVVFKAPKVTILNGAHFKNGSVVNIVHN